MAHVPVLLNEVLEILEPKSGKIFVDGTVGGGGHAVPIIERLAPGGTFLGIDWDEELVKNLESRIKNLTPRLKRIVVKAGNYADLPEILEEEHLGKIDGLLVDLGFASEQLERGKGFSFMKNEPLIMTYSKDTSPAYQVLNQLNRTELERILRDYGEERYAARIAEAIREREKKSLIRTTGELAEVVRQAVPNSYERGRINPATRTFMALRIYVNDELENLKKLLRQISEIMNSGGRVAIISFHSLEDRLVKNHFRDLAKEGKVHLLTKKPITSTEEEARANPRSRSAKLRAIEII
ncbi:MAG: 16S rRNA (cytosine(1402)-N(4))-methyltransferase RsmH [Candidatus Colwellbacteria bacterium]|nr:16S rRNA (cytosine(1402)-N(4))-methyltransferase RsmH [Candidatus Colwellbacteria bacterium]